MKKNKVIVFDLDDTLYKEMEFLKSGFRNIVKIVLGNEEYIYLEMLRWYFNKENVFKNLIDKYNLKFSILELIELYRTHTPKISLSKETLQLLKLIKNRGFFSGIITDGFSFTQRKKIEVLGLNSYFDEVIISEEFGFEKPNEKNYLIFESKFPLCQYIYIGDNFEKDFITPNTLGWLTVGLLDDGQNIHKQINLNKDYLPKFIVKDIIEIVNYL